MVLTSHTTLVQCTLRGLVPHNQQYTVLDHIQHVDHVHCQTKQALVQSSQREVVAASSPSRIGITCTWICKIQVMPNTFSLLRQWSVYVRGFTRVHLLFRINKKPMTATAPLCAWRTWLRTLPIDKYKGQYSVWPVATETTILSLLRITGTNSDPCVEGSLAISSYHHWVQHTNWE